MNIWIVWVQVQLPDFRRRHQLTMAPMAFTVALVLLSCSVAAVCWSSASERLHVIPVSWQVQAPIFGLQAVNTKFIGLLLYRRSSQHLSHP